MVFFHGSVVTIPVIPKHPGGGSPPLLAMLEPSLASGAIPGPPGCGDAMRNLRNTLWSLDWFKGKSTGNHCFYHQI
jgi:hypothetical protein